MTSIDDLAAFARWHIDSGDIDPAYPVLVRVAEQLRYGRAELADLVFLYVTYYDLASALGVIDAEGRSWPTWPRLPEWLALPTGTERRAHRSPRRLHAHLVHLDQLREAWGGLDRWVDSHCWSQSGADNWRRLQQGLRAISGNGRWAAYKTGEILAYCGWPLVPTDAGHDFSTGPRQGLGLVLAGAAELRGHTPEVVAALDAYTEDLRSALSRRLARHVPVEQLETVLCDWHSMVGGRYYVGHDIDQQLQQVLRPGVHQAVRQRILAARSAAFDVRWLGEARGWNGVRKPLRTLWRDGHRLEWWEA